jgi:hypothetical protein
MVDHLHKCFNCITENDNLAKLTNKTYHPHSKTNPEIVSSAGVGLSNVRL